MMTPEFCDCQGTASAAEYRLEHLQKFCVPSDFRPLRLPEVKAETFPATSRIDAGRDLTLRRQCNRHHY